VKRWRSLVPRRESGQAVFEYALVLALVAAGLLVGLLLLRSSLGHAYGRVAHRVQPPSSPGSESGAVADTGGGKAGVARPGAEAAKAEKEH
jgi:Flp pilus assembly pilin Flp